MGRVSGRICLVCFGGENWLQGNSNLPVYSVQFPLDQNFRSCIYDFEHFDQILCQAAASTHPDVTCNFWRVLFIVKLMCVKDLIWRKQPELFLCKVTTRIDSETKPALWSSSKASIPLQVCVFLLQWRKDSAVFCMVPWHHSPYWNVFFLSCLKYFYLSKYDFSVSIYVLVSTPSPSEGVNRGVRSIDSHVFVRYNGEFRGVFQRGATFLGAWKSILWSGERQRQGKHARLCLRPT